MNEAVAPHRNAPGTVGVLSADLARYADFSIALAHLQLPADCNLVWARGVDIVGNMNQIRRQMTGEWLWILGDDHVFESDLLIRLLAHDLDVVVPLCLKRSPPYDPVVYSHQNDRGEYCAALGLPAHGTHPIWACGSAGMLIRRHVLDAIPDPVFAAEGRLNEDFVLCRKIREAGYRIHADVDALLGHIGQVTVWPHHTGSEWQIRVDLGNGQQIPIQRVVVDEADEAAA